MDRPASGAHLTTALGGANLEMTMSRIAYFFGISIYMYYREHMPPHFHAIYAEHDAEVELDGLTLLSGVLPPRVRGLVVEWAALHREELRQVWQQARTKQPLSGIPPLQ